MSKPKTKTKKVIPDLLELARFGLLTKLTWNIFDAFLKNLYACLKKFLILQ